MNIAIYIIIFVFKVLENSLGTLRMIFISNGRKQIGAFLQLIIALIWILTTSMVIVDINKDPLKIFVFVFGTYIGSLVGSIIEEKLALGANLIIVITNDVAKCMLKSIRKKGFAVTSFKGKGQNSFRTVLIIYVKRKLRNQIFKIIKKCDNEAMIITFNASATGGYH